MARHTTKEREMKTTNYEMRTYLGDMSIDEFESEEQIREYFSVKNLTEMFGDDLDDATYGDIRAARSNVIEDWREIKEQEKTEIRAEGADHSSRYQD
jgi:hypothetical protein